MKRKTTDRSRKAAARVRKRSAAAIDRLHDSGRSMLPVLDLSSRRRSNAGSAVPTSAAAARIRRVNVDFPEWMVAELDREAEHLGVTRQSVIKVFIAEQLRSARSA
jgi:hypothetical protein